jgi:hypothetical protein
MQSRCAGLGAGAAVTTPKGTSPLSTHDRFRFTPVVKSVAPNSGTTAGGTTVTITGTGFVEGATVIKFGSAKATSASCSSWDSAHPTLETTCTAVTPSHAAGTVNVNAIANKVISLDTAADLFTYS